MMNYDSALYNFVMLFSFDDIVDYRIILDKLGRIVERELQNETIKCKGFVKYSNRHLESIRKSKFNPETIKVKLKEKLDESSESIILIFADKNWSNQTPPRVLISVHLTKNSFNSISLTSNGRELKSFYLFALRTDVKASLDASNFFDEMNGSYGYYFENTNYAYDGTTYLEWMYNNKPIQIKDGDINRWIEPIAQYNLYSE